MRWLCYEKGTTWCLCESHINYKGCLTFFKISKKAIERSESLREEYRYNIGEKYTPEQLVFVDESACDRRTYYRDQAWALIGRRACQKQYFTRWKRYASLFLSDMCILTIIQLLYSPCHKYGQNGRLYGHRGILQFGTLYRLYQGPIRFHATIPGAEIGYCYG